jgi:hypothetical protein
MRARFVLDVCQSITHSNNIDHQQLRLVYLLLIHQKPINYDNFDPGTGHSIRAIQGIIERIGQKVATDPTPNKSVTPAAKPTPKKRGRPAKNAEVGSLIVDGK